MGNRRRARECALQVMYDMDISSTPVRIALANYFATYPQHEEVQIYCETIVNGFVTHQGEIDELISKQSTHWRLDRMALIDRNILRLAVYELVRMDDVPLKVVLNEAIEIGKKYGTEDTGAFINGILDHLAKKLGRS